jgi:hypothetical protein
MLRNVIRSILSVFVFGVLAAGPFGGLTTASAQGSQARIWTDKNAYTVGENTRFCYSVPRPAYIEVTDILADGTASVFFSANDDGRGDCIAITITPPSGLETLRLSVYSGNRLIATAETRFRVLLPMPDLNYRTADPSADMTPEKKRKLMDHLSQQGYDDLLAAAKLMTRSGPCLAGLAELFATYGAVLPPGTSEACAGAYNVINETIDRWYH